MKKRLILTSIISIVLVVVLMIGSTYSIFVTSNVDEDLNVYKTGNLDVTYTLSEENVTFTSNLPVSDKDVIGIKPYRITVNNVGNVAYKFDLVLEDMTATEKIDYQYIMTKVGDLEAEALSECEGNVIREGIVVPANDSAVIDVRVYLSEDVQNTEIGKSFYGKLSIEGNAVYAENDEIDNSALIAPSVTKVTFDANGGTTPVESNVVIYGQTYGELPTPTRTGYTFEGWYTSLSGGEEVTSSSTVNIITNQTIYARWTANTYTVSFNANGGSTTTANKTVTYGDEYGSLPTPTRDGYTFVGWYTAETNGENITSGSEVSIDSDHTLYARWTADAYTVTYNVDGNTYTEDVKNGESALSPTTFTPSKSGWTFVGWREDDTASADVLSNKVVNDEPVNLYAVFSKELTQTFINGNGTTTQTAYNYSNNGNIGKSTFTMPTVDELSGWTVRGWSDNSSQANADVYYSGGETGVTATIENTFYALYEQTITLSYSGNGATSGSVSSHDGMRYYNASGNTSNPSFTLKSNGFSRTGYTFNGWNLGTAGATIILSSSTTASAQWTANQYTVTFNANGGSVTTTSKSVTYGDLYGDLPTPTREGYTFAGWYTDISGGTKIDPTTPVSITSAKTLYANWNVNTYTLSFNANGGSVSPNSKIITYNNIFTDMPTPTKSNYLFSRWYANFTGSNYLNLGRSYMYTDKISIHFDVWMSDWSIYSDDSQRMISCTESGGWNIETNDGYIQFAMYDNGVGYKSAKTSKTWSSLSSGWHTFDMVFDGTKMYGYLDGSLIATSETFESGAIGYNSTNSLFVGAEAGSDVANPYGQYFTGYISNLVIKNDSNRITSADNNFVTPKHDFTLYAYWDEHTITFDANGGSVSPNTRTMSYNTIFNNMPTPTRSGYSFSRWYANFTGTNYLNLGRSYMYTDKISIHFDAWMSDWSIYSDDSQRMISCTESGGWNIEANDGYIQFAMYDNGIEYKTVKTSQTWSSLLAGWHTFDMVFDGTKMYGYLDGSLIATSETFSSGAIGYNSTNSLFVGAEAGSDASTPAGNYFNGYISNLVIKNDSNRITGVDNTFVMPKHDFTLYAHWPGDEYIVTFNANGGSVSTFSKIVTYASTYGDLPTPSRSGYSFNGWFTASSGGSQVTSSTIVSITSTQTLYAQWTALNYDAVRNTYASTVSCSSGYTYNGSTCTISYTNNGAQCGYSCSSGTLSGSSCIITSQYQCGTENCNCHDESRWYCDAGYIDDNGEFVCTGDYVETTDEVCDTCPVYCDRTDTVAATANSCTKTDASKLTYSCPNYNASLSGTTCVYYTCPNGGTLSGTTCVFN